MQWYFHYKWIFFDDKTRIVAYNVEQSPTQNLESKVWILAKMRR